MAKKNVSKNSLLFSRAAGILLGLTTGIAAFIFFVFPAFAAPELVIMGKPVVNIITEAVDWLVTITAILAILMVVAGGITLIFSSGDPRKAAFAKKIIFWALGGLMIVGLPYAVIVSVEKIIIG